MTSSVARLAASVHRDKFVLKGGVLLAAFGARRPTRDVDLAALDVTNSTDHVIALLREIVAVPLDDGLVMDRESLRGEAIRDADEYPGVRVTLAAGLHSARLRVHIDVNVGDPIDPEPIEVSVPRLLGNSAPIVVRGYPIQMVLAEKMVTAVQRGIASTRWRDFGDVWTLSHRESIDGTALTKAITTVADARRATLMPLSRALDGYVAVAQTKWDRWLRRQRLPMPSDFAQVLQWVIAFADPAITGQVTGKVWNPETAQWV